MTARVTARCMKLGGGHRGCVLGEHHAPPCRTVRGSEPPPPASPSELRHIEVIRYAVELEELVKWLALPYGENQPIFATSLPDGRILETGVKMMALYRHVVGSKQWVRGTWVQCQHCSQMYVKSELLEGSGP
jgi:hypothetical protein